MNASRPRCCALAVCSLLMLAVAGRAQDAAQDKPIELPAYNVTDTRDLPPPERWSYARIPGFEVLSSTSDRATQRLVRDFARFHVALGLVWPGVQQSSATPAALIICGRGGKFEKFRPAGETAPDRGAVSFSLRKREESAIVLDFQTKVLNLATIEGAAAGAPIATEDGVTSAGGGDPGIEVDSYKQLYREYIRFLLSGVEPRAPAWFEEGVAQIFMAMDVTRTEITVGKLENPNEISVEQAAINAASGQLPKNLPSPPTYRKVNPADSPILLLSATSDTMPLTAVDDEVETKLGQQLSQLPGVAQVLYGGQQKPAIRVQLDPAKLVSKGLTLEDVRTQLNGVTVKIFDAKPIPAKDPKGIAGKLGEIVAVEADGITVVCADGRFKVTRVQPTDGKRMEVGECAKNVSVAAENLEPYGHYKAKISLEYLDSLKGRHDGKLILVTAISPTPAGEGKTTTTVGLGDGLNRIGKKAMSCLREPSLGPCFGMKGGAAGGGYAQVVPMEDINLHFTGDFHAITTAHNLLAAMIDNHVHWGNALDIDTRRIVWRRVRRARHRHAAHRLA
eukprot:gene35913-48307_t